LFDAKRAGVAPGSGSNRRWKVRRPRPGGRGLQHPPLL